MDIAQQLYGYVHTCQVSISKQQGQKYSFDFHWFRRESKYIDISSLCTKIRIYRHRSALHANQNIQIQAHFARESKYIDIGPLCTRIKIYRHRSTLHENQNIQTQSALHESHKGREWLYLNKNVVIDPVKTTKKGGNPSNLYKKQKYIQLTSMTL